MDEQRISREQVESAAGDSWSRFRSAFTDQEEVEIIKRLATAFIAADDALRSQCWGCANNLSEHTSEMTGYILHRYPDGEHHVCGTPAWARAAMLLREATDG